MKLRILVVLVVIAAVGSIAFAQSMTASEPDIDRLGSDIEGIDLPIADAELCKNQCAANPQCVAWTYVKPNTTRGPLPRCFTKFAVPDPTVDTCCVSGVKVR